MSSRPHLPRSSCRRLLDQPWHEPKHWWARPPEPQVEPAPPGAGADIEDAEEDTGEMGTDELMRLALVNLLSKETKGKKSARLGLPLAQSSESEEEDPLRRLSGAKGTMLVERLRVAMEADPAAYANAIENLAAQVLGEATPNPMTLERYVREELPMGNERSLGFAAWIMVRAVTRMKAGQWEKGRLVLTLGLAAVEQYRLDGNWTTAWRLTQLSQPPFSEWRSREPYMSQLRVDHAHSRLVHPTWAAAVIARLKDEEVLVKRRRRPDGGRPDDRPPRGKGRGRGSTADAPQQ